MATWSEFESDAPDIAAAGRQMLYQLEKCLNRFSPWWFVDRLPTLVTAQPHYAPLRIKQS